MSAHIAAGPVHHLRLTVTDIQRSRQFYTSLLDDEQGVPHGTITRLPSFGIDVLPFEDPDGIQLELTAPADQPAPQG
jgi:catechol 2,3-dioxygenase-like lactoylglutathione lyase family enzyme